MSRLVEVRVPDMGSFSDVAVIDVLVKPGENIEREASLVTLETEKATMDVPSDVSGVVEKVHVQKGGKVSAGAVVATVRVEGEGADAGATASKSSAGDSAPASAAPAATSNGAAASGADEAGSAKVTNPAAAASAAGTAVSGATAGGAPSGAHSASGATAQATAASAGPSSAPSSSPPTLSVIVGGRTDLAPIDEPGFSRAHAGPSVRKFARELGVDLTNVGGTGFKGRLTHDDVKAYVKKVMAGGATAAAGSAGGAAKPALPAVPVVDFAKFGPVETKPLSRIQKISGPRLQASWVNLPHVTQFDEADITDLEDVRTKLKQKAAKEGIKLTPLAFILRAVVKALQEFPTFNASLDPDGANLIMKKYTHIGFAADTPGGLVVPVIRDADHKDVYEIARQLAELSEKARAGKLQATEMQGGCFTISSLGGIGGTAFTPIINAPEVAILGVSRSSMKPVYRDGSFVPRLMLPLSLSYDHRVIDGAMAARFTTHLAGVLADPRQLTEAVP
jgi:pyruvate dehydrogenase E2 component (dihydrolipoamide acetyltransferase)